MNRVVAVTGATGRIGAPLVDALLSTGHMVRALSRRTQAPRPEVEWVIGDLLDPAAVAALLSGADTVFHAGGQLHGSPDAVERSMVDGIRNVVQAAGSARVVHLSSLVVLDTGSASPALVDEDCPLELFPDRRGAYTRAKVAAEGIARAAAARQDVVIVRPGLVMPSPGAPMPPSIGIRVGPAMFLIGPRHAALPVVHAIDVASGLLCAAARLEPGGVLHLVDPMAVTRAALFRRLSQGRTAISIPGGGASLFAARRLASGRDGRIATAAYRLLAAGEPHRWSAARALALGWQPVALEPWFAHPAD